MNLFALLKVDWFPRHVSELDLIANRVLDAGIDLEADHPGFYDPMYRQRRQELADVAINHRWNTPIADIEYTENEIKCWTAVRVVVLPIGLICYHFSGRTPDHLLFVSNPFFFLVKVWDRMESLWEKHACKEYLHSLDLMKKHCNYERTSIPKQSDISTFLESTTNFKLRPVAGLLSSRDFLNGLAHRTFFCTQYIRVSSDGSFYKK